MTEQGVILKVEEHTGWMDGWMLFNDISAQFRPFGVLERLEIKPF